MAAPRASGFKDLSGPLPATRLRSATISSPGPCHRQRVGWLAPIRAFTPVFDGLWARNPSAEISAIPNDGLRRSAPSPSYTHALTACVALPTHAFAIHSPKISVHSAHPTERETRVAFFSRATPATRAAIDRLSTSTRVFALNIHISTPPSSCPVRLRCFREALRRQSGMRRPAGLPNASNPPGGVRRHRPSATTSGTCERSNARPKSTAPSGIRSLPLAKAGRSQKTAATERRKAGVPGARIA
jgi:hypothetical protein